LITDCPAGRPKFPSFEACYNVTDEIKIFNLSADTNEIAVMAALETYINDGTLEQIFDDIQNENASGMEKDVFILVDIETAAPTLPPATAPTKDPTPLPPANPGDGCDQGCIIKATAGVAAALIILVPIGVIIATWLALCSTVIVIDFTIKMGDEALKDKSWRQYVEDNQVNTELWFKANYPGEELKPKHMMSNAPKNDNDGDSEDNQTMEQIGFKLTCEKESDYSKCLKQFIDDLVERYGESYEIDSLVPHLTWKGSVCALISLPTKMVERAFDELKIGKDSTFYSGGGKIYLVEGMAPGELARNSGVKVANNLLKRLEGSKGSDVLLHRPSLKKGSDQGERRVDLLIPNSKRGANRLQVLPFYKKESGSSSWFFTIKKAKEPEPVVYEVTADATLLVKETEKAIIKDLQDRGYVIVKEAPGGGEEYKSSHKYIRMAMANCL
jgi:hypothetical protein